MKDFIETLYNAYNNFSTVEAVFIYCINRCIMNKALSRWMSKYNVIGRFRERRPKKKKGEIIETFRWHIWHQKPSLWRFENKDCKGVITISIINNNFWWYYNSEGKLFTNVPPLKGKYAIKKVSFPDNLTNITYAIQDMPFLNPAFLLSSHELSLTGSRIHAGREAFCVKGIPRSGGEPAWDPFFWGGGGMVMSFWLTKKEEFFSNILQS